MVAKVGLPDITNATRLQGRRGSGEEQECLGGWRVDTPEGEVFLSDRLGIRWGPVLLERWRPVDLVPRDAYVGMPRAITSNLEHCRPCVGTESWPLHALKVASDADYFDAVARGRIVDGRSGDCRAFVPADAPPRNVFAVVAIRFAEMRGRDDVAEALVREHAEQLGDLRALGRDLVRWRLQWGWWALANGMPRTKVADAWLEAATMPHLPEASRERLERAAERLGPDPSGPSEGELEVLVVRLAEDAYFPDSEWVQGADFQYETLDRSEWPQWARLEGLQPMSPAWELVRIGWSALPRLRGVMDSGVPLRRGLSRYDEHGEPVVVAAGSVGALALDVASTIAARRFDDVVAFDAWWASVGHEGWLAAHRWALIDEDEADDLPRVVWDLLAEASIDPWPVLAEALAGSDPVRVSRAIEDALWPYEGAPAAEVEEHAEALEDVFAPLLRDPDPMRREAAAIMLARTGYWGIGGP